MEKEWFTRRLDELRKERGWSKCKLNDEAGFSAGMIYQWYNTARTPTIQNVEMICKACGISLSEFFSDGDSQTDNCVDAEFQKLYGRLSLEQKVFVREMTARLLKLAKKE